MGGKKVIISEDDKEKILELYKNGSSLRQIERDVRIGRNIIKKYLLSENESIRDYKYYHNTDTHRKYYFNHDYFENIDTEEKAYWLGFIWADGCIIKRGEDSYLISIALQESDKEHLEKFKKCINSNHEIKIYRAYDLKSKAQASCNIRISSKKMAFDLMKLGVMPNKSTSEFHVDFSKIDSIFIKDIIRGYYDGNGYYGIRKNAHEISACGNKESLIEISNFLINFGIYQHWDRRHKDADNNNYDISISKREYIYNFINLIYNNSNIHLSRKYDKVTCFLDKYDFKLGGNYEDYKKSS